MKGFKGMDQEHLINDENELIYVIDLENYNLLFLNKAAKKKMGLRDEEYKEKKCYQLLHGLSEPCLCCKKNLLSSNEIYKWENCAHRKEAYYLKHKLVDWKGKLVKLETGFQAIVEENKEDSHGEIELILLQAINDLMKEADFFEAMYLVLKKIGQIYNAESVYIVEIGAGRQGKILYKWNKNADTDEKALTLQDELLIGSWNRIGRGKKWNVLSIGEALHIVPMVDIEYGDGYFAIECIDAGGKQLSHILLIGHVILNEITKKNLQNKIEYINRYDALTGVFQRKLYLEHLRGLEEKEPNMLGVLLADINGLKKINEYYGNAQGDELLQITGNFLRGQFGVDSVFRLNGDEFIVLCENIQRKDFHLKVQSLKEDFEEMNYFGVSVGYTWSEKEFDLNQLIAHAEESLYIEKQKAYVDEEAFVKRNRPKHVNELLRSIGNKEYQMYLQPKNDMNTGELIGAEALVRYMHPQMGMIPPSKFIPALERERTIRYIDFFMYEEVCKIMEQWHKKGRNLLPVSLNFSRATILERDFMEQLLSIYEKYEIPYNCIEIEITESMGELEKETLSEISTQMREKGFRVSLDDFGSQYTNMAILTIMDFDTLKLDRSLVSRLEKSQENRIVVQHVIEMCKEMGVHCLAEGVENEFQKNLLREMGCDFAQGYLFNKPLPVSSFEAHYFAN